MSRVRNQDSGAPPPPDEAEPEEDEELEELPAS